MAFAEGGKGTEYVPTCHGCGRKCKGGWKKCPHITDEHRAKVAALDDAGHFRRGNNKYNRNNTSKKGTVNVAAAADKDDEDDEMSATQDMTFKECAEVSMTSKMGVCPDKVEKAIAELVKRVIP